jgi:hypothetical protein
MKTFREAASDEKVGGDTTDNIAFAIDETRDYSRPVHIFLVVYCRLMSSFPIVEKP